MPAAYDSVEKRNELVRAARELLHERGYHRTSLADVAELARIPLGNVHYYFKTKERLAEAVIASHEAMLRERFEFWSKKHAEPRKRLRELLRSPLDSSDSVIQFGCPHGSLCQELEKLASDTPLAQAGARLLTVYVDWCEEQFRALGARPREARALAEQLVSSMQGTMLLAHTMRSRELLASQLRRTEVWLNGVVSSN
jgi:AcrR family transcriptional regulator